MVEYASVLSKENLFLIRQFVCDRDVATVARSSKKTIKHICGHIDSSKPVTIVEYGPGTGVITRGLLKHIHPESRVICIERNAGLVEYMQRKLNDDRLRIYHGDVRDIKKFLAKEGVSQADYIISGIPFSFLPEDIRGSIVASTSDVLAPHTGKFIVYQFTDLMYEALQSKFPQVSKRKSWMNVPPLTVMVAEK